MLQATTKRDKLSRFKSLNEYFLSFKCQRRSILRGLSHLNRVEMCIYCTLLMLTLKLTLKLTLLPSSVFSEIISEDAEKLTRLSCGDC